MGSLTLRNIDETLKNGLRLSAAANGRSMEEEARQILRQHLLRRKCTGGLGTRIFRRFAVAGGVDLPEVKRSPARPPEISTDKTP
jgi:antitoxin FitA